MPLPSSGTLTLGQLQTEFGGTNPVGINEYYRGGALVPNTPSNVNVPTSGTISLANFYSASKQLGFLNLISQASGDTSTRTNPVVDTSGNVYWFGGQGNANLQQNKFTNKGATSINQAVAVTVASGIYVEAQAIAPSGNIYVAGSAFFSSVFKPWVAKYNSLGVFQWSTMLNIDDPGASNRGISGNFYSIALDASENVYVTGNVSILNVTYGGSGLLVSKFNSNGGLTWSNVVTPGQPGIAQVRAGGLGIAVDSANNVYVASRTDGNAGGSFAYAGLTKFDSNGNVIWYVNTYETAGQSTGASRDVSVDSSGNIYLTVSAGNFYTIKYNSSGSIIWQKILTPSFSISNGFGGQTKTIAVDSTNSFLYLSPGAGTGQVPIIKLDFNGNLIWSNRLNATQGGFGVFTITGGISLNGPSFVVSASANITSRTTLMFQMPTDGTGLFSNIVLNTATWNYASLACTVNNGALTNVGVSYAQSFRTITQVTASITTSGSTATIFSQIL
jgi:hypothetical protein